jgi:cytochrome c oxidase subunit 3
MDIHLLATKQYKLLMQLIIGLESFFFLSMIVGYIYYTVYSPAWEDSGNYLNIKQTAIFSLFLFSSSFLLILFEKSMKHKKRGLGILFLMLTILFGIIFMVGQTLEYYAVFKLELLPSTNIFGSAFFTLTGFHGIHVIIGLITLVILLFLLLFKSTREKAESAIVPIAMYWHFVDVIWVFVFFVIYLLPLIK